MKPVKERRSLLSRMALTLVGGLLYMSLLIQPACPGDDDNQLGSVDASVGFDAPPTSIDAPVGDTGPIGDTGPGAETGTTLSDCWQQVVGTHVQPDPACNIPTTTLSISGNQIQANPFGQGNTNVLFTPKAGLPNEATAMGLIIFSAGDHTCTLTCIPGATAAASKISVACTNPEGGSCGPGTFNRAN